MIFPENRFMRDIRQAHVFLNYYDGFTFEYFSICNAGGPTHSWHALNFDKREREREEKTLTECDKTI